MRLPAGRKMHSNGPFLLAVVSERLSGTGSEDGARHRTIVRVPSEKKVIPKPVCFYMVFVMSPAVSPTGARYARAFLGSDISK